MLAIVEQQQQVGLELERCYDPTAINSVLNDPSVRPHIAPADVEGLMDATQTVVNPLNVWLWTPLGGFLYEWQGQGTYEVHTQFLPEGHGMVAMRLAKKSIKYMFTQTDCVEILTRVPEYNTPAKGLAKAVGFQHDFYRPGAWRRPSGDMESVEHMLLTWRDWIRTTPSLAEAGEQFHNRLDLLLSAGASHGPDNYHDRVVGATLAGLCPAALDKSLFLYNRWARSAGYAAVQLLSRSPVVVDIQDAVLVLDDTGCARVLLDRTKKEPS